MDTPGHVSVGDGQVEDEYKWSVGGGEEKERKVAKYRYQRKRLCQGLESHGTCSSSCDI